MLSERQGVLARLPAWAGRPERRTWPALLIPDLAAVAALAALCYCLFLFDAPRRLFHDSDAGWHIRNGEAILATGRLPHADPYSFTRAGQPWVAWEWVSDVLMAVAHKVAGLDGVAALYCSAIALSVWLWFRLNWVVGGGFLAPALALLYAAGHWMRTALWRDADQGSGVRTVRVFLWAAAIAATATFINPYGWNLHRHVASYLLDSDLLARIGEFQSFNFHAGGAPQILLALLVASAGSVASFAGRRVTHAFVGLLLVGGALRSARVLPLMALVALPLANGALSEAAVLCGGLRPAIRRRLDAALTYSGNLRRLDSSLGGAIWLPLAAAALMAAMPTAAFPPSEFPVHAATAIETLPATARVLATDKFGGYLIYRFAGRRKVFFDGRSDLYGSGFLIEYGRLIQARPGWQAIVDRYGFSHALLPADSPLVAALETAGWRRLSEDPVAVLLERGL